MNENPLVSVNILSFNRKEELKNTLTKVHEQDYKNIEIIVVDNASSDGSAEMVEKEFPDVHLIKLDKNIGIAGWNEGFKVAKGKYVLVLDDDAYPEKNAIRLSLKEFQNDNSLACITLNLVDLNTNDFYFGNWLPFDKKGKKEWPIFVGCAFIVLKSRLPDNFQFPENYFIYQHELPMSAVISIYNKRIYFIPEIVGYHNFKSNNLYNKFNDLMIFKNTLRFIIDYIPLIFCMFYYFQIIFFYLTRAIKYNWFEDYMRIISHTWPITFSKKISFEYFFKLRKLRVFNFSILSKVIRK